MSFCSSKDLSKHFDYIKQKLNNLINKSDILRKNKPEQKLIKLDQEKILTQNIDYYIQENYEKIKSQDNLLILSNLNGLYKDILGL